jgi:hypothetical protein
MKIQPMGAACSIQIKEQRKEGSKEGKAAGREEGRLDT